MTRLTVDPRVATVIAVAHSQSVSCGTSLDWRPITAPSPVAPGGGVPASGGWDYGWIMRLWIWSLNERAPHGKPLKIRENSQEYKKPRRLVERAGSSKKPMISIKSELPACLLGKVILCHAQGLFSIPGNETVSETRLDLAEGRTCLNTQPRQGRPPGRLGLMGM